MKVKFSKIIRTISGEPVPDGAEPLTMGKLAVNALLANFQDEQNIAGEEKFKRYRLATRIQELVDDADVSVEDLALIKQLVGKAFVTEIVGRFYSNLEGE